MTTATLDMVGQLSSAADVQRYMLAGRAKITIRSVKTGNRFTYKVTKKKEGAIWFVNLLRGPDNENDFQYMGVIKPSGKGFIFTRTAKSRVTDDAVSMEAFKWMFNRVSVNLLPDNLEVWHEGTCGRCGRSLTVPESVERGLGPECVNKM
jgi:hypothetical protein